MSALDADGLMAFLRRGFPLLQDGLFTIESLDEHHLAVRMRPDETHLRPGGTVSGPTLMLLADVVAYLAVAHRVGPVTAAVTTSLTIHFLERPGPRDVVGRGRVLRLGQRAAVVEVELRSDEVLVAHATVAYAVPKDGGVEVRG